MSPPLKSKGYIICRKLFSNTNIIVYSIYFNKLEKRLKKD